MDLNIVGTSFIKGKHNAKPTFLRENQLRWMISHVPCLDWYPEELSTEFRRAYEAPEGR